MYKNRKDIENIINDLQSKDWHRDIIAIGGRLSRLVIMRGDSGRETENDRRSGSENQRTEGDGSEG